MIQGVTALLLLSGEARIWHLVVLYGLHATASAFFMPASTALVPQVTPPERLQEANALLGITRSIAMGFGAALGGVFVSLISHGRRRGAGRLHVPDQRRLPGGAERARGHRRGRGRAS